MRRTLLALAASAVAATVVAPAFGQSGLRVDPRLQGQFGRAPSQVWNTDAAHDPIGAARYALVPQAWRLIDRAGFGMSYGGMREPDSYGLAGLGAADPNGVSMSGHFWFSPSWAVSAEAATGDGIGLQPRQVFRFGLHRQF